MATISASVRLFQHLAQSLIETKELLCANNLNYSFNSSYPGGDGVCLVNSSHPIAVGSFEHDYGICLVANVFEQMLIQIRSNGRR